MKSGLLRVPVTNNDTVLGDAQFSKSSTFASSARLLCSFSLILRAERFRFGGLRGTGGRGLDEDRRGSGSRPNLDNRSGPQSGSFNHGSMAT